MSQSNPIHALRHAFAHAIAEVSARPVESVDPQIRASADPTFGDFQCNAAMALAKSVGSKPREVAERIRDAVAPLLGELAEPLQIAGPGFINIQMRSEALSAYLASIPAGPEESSDQVDRLGIPIARDSIRVIVDYSSPNIAKQMHVGHLRSTIIGDVLARVLSFQGHDVVRQNHVGDWGTQFGLLIHYYSTHPFPDRGDHDANLSAIEDDYRAANERFKSDAAFADAARLAVGRLQSGDATARDIWRRVCESSASAFRDNYRRLGVLLTDDDIRGESFYNNLLAATVEELRHDLPRRPDPASQVGDWAEVADDQGAVCIFFHKAGGEPTFKTADGGPLPLIIRKSDGAYLYASTDLAAIRHRICELRAQRVLYVVGAPTRLHLDMVFAAARLAGWTGGVSLEHVSFGQVLGEDRKLLRTRTGGAVKLRDLLDEAESRASAMLESKLQQEPPVYRDAISVEERRTIANRVGVGAVKYADLSRERNNDYVFNWDQMLALQGNTAPYLLYAYTRRNSILKAAGAVDLYGPGKRIMLDHPTERAIALRLARLGDTIGSVASESAPHILCTYLFELAGEFMRFYEACPVLKAPTPELRESRLRLCDLSARALRTGLSLLGIRTVTRM